MLKSSSLLGCQASNSSRPDRKKLMGSVVPVSKYRAGEAMSRDRGQWGRGARGGSGRPVPAPHLAAAAGGC